MTAMDSTTLRIGAWRVDPALDEISKDGKTVKLEHRAMQLLLCLAEHAGNVVSVEQLLDQVWEGVMVTPDSVYHAVAALRRMLGEDSQGPHLHRERPTTRVSAGGARRSVGRCAERTRTELAGSRRQSSLRDPLGGPDPFVIRRSAQYSVGVAALALGYFVVDKLWL